MTIFIAISQMTFARDHHGPLVLDYISHRRFCKPFAARLSLQSRGFWPSPAPEPAILDRKNALSA